MKKILCSLFGYAFALAAFSQTPITITQANYPLFTDFTQRTPTSIANPTITPNNTWDYGNVTGSVSTTNYYAETDPFFTAAGIDVWNSGSISMTPSLGYNVTWEYDFNANGVDEKGVYVFGQAYDLSGLTRSLNDSIFFPLQSIIFNSPRRILKFPCTFGDSWSSVSRREVDFVLNVPSFALNYAPAKHIITMIKQDTIKTWGKMRLYTANGASIYYDVIMNKIKQTTIDSFYLGGSPAPGALLTGFGVTQGQTTISNRYIFYRENYSTPMAIFNYGSNNYTTPVSVFLEAANLQTSGVGIENQEEAYSTLFFPNPTSNGSVNIQFVGIELSEIQFSIIDMTGKTIQAGFSTVQNGLLTIPTHEMANGIYTIQISDKQKGMIATEKVIVNK